MLPLFEFHADLPMSPRPRAWHSGHPLRVVPRVVAMFLRLSLRKCPPQDKEMGAEVQALLCVLGVPWLKWPHPVYQEGSLA